MKAKIIYSFEDNLKFLKEDGFDYFNDPYTKDFKFWFNIFKDEILDVFFIDPVISPSGQKFGIRCKIIFKGLAFHIHPKMVELIE